MERMLVETWVFYWACRLGWLWEHRWEWPSEYALESVLGFVLVCRLVCKLEFVLGFLLVMHLDFESGMP
jgi:hypothetical protein